MSDIFNLTDSIDMILQVSALCGVEEKGKELIEEIQSRFDNLKLFNPVSSLYLIWKKPYMAVGQNTFIHQMMGKGGFENVIIQDRYPELSEEEIIRLNPEVVLLSSEPYPFAGKHQQEVEALLPHANVMLVDGELFSWYGSRLLQLPAYLQKLRSHLQV